MPVPQALLAYAALGKARVVRLGNRASDGAFATRALIRGILLDTESATLVINGDKVRKSRMILADPLLDPGFVRIPINIVETLMG